MILAVSATSLIRYHKYSYNLHVTTGGTSLTISGSGFGVSADSSQAISVGGVAAGIVSYTDSEVEVALPALAPGSYPLVFAVTGKGNADVR